MNKLNTILSERDIKIFEIIKKFGWLREDYLAKYLGLNWNDLKVKTSLYTLAYRLKKDRFITKEKIIDGYPGYWSLGKNGAEFVSGKEEQKLMSLGTLRHNDMVANLAINLIVKEPLTEITTEYELKQELFGSENKNKKLPDLVINGKIAIEVEVSKKNDNKLAQIISHYLTSNYEQVIYYTNSTGIANKINRIAKKHSKFKFKLFKETNILLSEDYKPLEISELGLARNLSGQFTNSSEEKLRSIGAIP